MEIATLSNRCFEALAGSLLRFTSLPKAWSIYRGQVFLSGPAPSSLLAHPSRPEIQHLKGLSGFVPEDTFHKQGIIILPWWRKVSRSLFSKNILQKQGMDHLSAWSIVVADSQCFSSYRSDCRLLNGILVRATLALMHHPLVQHNLIGNAMNRL